MPHARSQNHEDHEVGTFLRGPDLFLGHVRSRGARSSSNCDGRRHRAPPLWRTAVDPRSMPTSPTETERSDSPTRVRAARSRKSATALSVHASMKRLVKSPRCSRHRGLILGRLPVSARRPLTQLRGRARERVLLKPCRRSSNSVPRRTIPARSLILLSALSVAPSAPAHHTGCEWRSGAPCVPALTCGQGMHTRSLLQLDDHAVTRSYAMAAVTAGASPVNTAARRRAGW